MAFFYLLVILILANIFKGRFLTPATRKHFMPALMLKLLGAISLGLVYEFYYGYGGDTFGYYFYPGRYVTDVIFSDPGAWFQLVFFPVSEAPELYAYTSRIFTYFDPPTYFVARFVGFFGVFTLKSYYATALLFGVISFTGVWALYHTFCKLYPKMALPFAIACLYIPSLWFWGSGILKDSLTISAMGWLIYGVFEMYFHRRYTLLNVIILIISFYILMVVKVYILMCLIPALIFLMGYKRFVSIKNLALRILMLPFILALVGFGGTYALIRIGEQNQRYNVENLTYTASTTAEWLEFVGEKEQGSVYSLGEVDYSPVGLIQKAPLATTTGLFRPFLWEVRNVVMLMSAIEGTFILFILFHTFFKTGFFNFFREAVSDPIIGFCFIFAIVFAFAIGLATYNFGSLVRYRIPLIPLFLIGLYLVQERIKPTMVKKRIY